jgi:glycosyltransferase involved in cell wall biosynthesis
MVSIDPLVTICIPAFNSEKWIEATICSALAQTWLNKEIIIVDDGSTDRTNQIIRHYESSNVKIIEQENKGACVARNRALNIAKGDFIQWLDADDMLAPDKIARQLQNSDMNPESMTLHSCSWGHFYYCLSRAKFETSPLWRDLSSLDWLLTSFNTRHMMPNHAWLVSRKITNLAGQWNENIKINQDGEYFCRVVSSCEHVKYHSESVCFYRKGNVGSITARKKSLEAISFAYNLCVDNLLKYKNDSITRAAAISFLKDFVSSYYDDGSEVFIENKKRILILGGTDELPCVSMRYKIAKKIFGNKGAVNLKSKTSSLKIYIEKWIDKLLRLFGCS